MGEGGIRNYQVNYEITAGGNAATVFETLSKNAQTLLTPLEKLKAQVNETNAALTSVRDMLKAALVLDLTGLKTGLEEAENLVATSAAKMAKSLEKALGKGATLNTGQMAGQAKKGAQEMVASIRSEMGQIVKDFDNTKGKLTKKSLKDLDANGKMAITKDLLKGDEQLLNLYNRYTDLNKQLVKAQKTIAKPSKTASAIINTAVDFETLNSTAAAIRNLNGAVKEFNNRKAISVKINADATKAIGVLNEFLTKARESVAIVPLSAKAPEVVKGGGAKGKGTAANENEQVITINTKLESSNLAKQLTTAVETLQTEATKLPVKVSTIIDTAVVTEQLTQSIVKLQELANAKPVDIKITGASKHTALSKTASALKRYNEAAENFNSRKEVKLKINADTSKAATAYEDFLAKVKATVATIPLSAQPVEVTKKGGRGTTMVSKGAVTPVPETVANVTKGKKQATEIKAKLNTGELVSQLTTSITELQKLADKEPIRLRSMLNGGNAGFQLNESIAKLQKLIDKEPIRLRSMFNGGDAGFQLNEAIVKLQKLADSKPIMLRATISAQAPLPNYGTTAPSTVAPVTQNGAANLGTATAKNVARQAKLEQIAKASYYNDAELAKIRNIARNNAEQLRVAQKLESNKQYTANVNMPKKDFNSRAKAFWYPLTGNTSFGARTPMAVEMAKGMGTMFAIGGAMSAVGGSLKQAVEYQNVMKTTNAILKNGTDNYSDGAFKGMEQIVRQVGKDTKFTAPEVAHAAKFLAMAGYDIPAINAAIKPVSNIALIGDTNLGETADKLTNVMTTFGIAPEKMSDIADIMTTTFTRSNTDMMMLAESAKYAGGIAHLYGGSFKNNFADVMAMFGVMGNAGIQASSAGTTLRMMYQNLMQPNKNQKAALKKYGISARDAYGKPLEMVDILKQIAAKVPKGELADAVGKMFRITAQPGAAALATHLDGRNGLIALMNANRAAAGTGISERIANEKKNTIAGLWAQVSSTFTEGILQAFEGKEGGWAGMLARLRDYLAQPETVEMLRSIVNLVEELAKVIGQFVKIYAKVYDMFPGLINGWMKFQLIMTQMGYLATPLIQLATVMNMLKTSITGVTAATATATVVEKAVGKERKANAVANVVGKFAPTSRYADYVSSGSAAANYAAYKSSLNYWNGKRTGLKYFANIHGEQALKNLKGMPESAWWAIAATNPALASAIKTNPSMGLALMADKYPSSSIATEYNKAARAANYARFAEGGITKSKVQYFGALRKIRRPEQLGNQALLKRYLSMGKDPAFLALATQRRNDYAARINDIATQRHAARRYVGLDVASRYARTARWKKGAGFALRNGWAAGLAAGTFKLTGIVAKIKGLIASVFGGLAKAMGMLLSPVGLVTLALAGLGATAYGVYNSYQQHKRNVKLAEDNQKVIRQHQKDIRDSYTTISNEVYGIKPVSVNIEKPQVAAKPSVGLLSKNKIVNDLLNKESVSGLSGRYIMDKYVSDFKYLPENYVSDYHKKYRDPGVRGFYSSTLGTSATAPSNAEVQGNAIKLGVVTQWAKMATEQEDVKKSLADLQTALKNKNFNLAQRIVESYKPVSQLSMLSESDAKAISQIQDPKKYYEWQYAQYKVLKDSLSAETFASKYSHALDLIEGFKEFEKERNRTIADNKQKGISDVPAKFDGTQIAQTLVQSLSVAINGTTASITLDKMGRIDWLALANSVNNKIPFTANQQADILNSVYEAIYNDPNIKNFASVIELLNTYLPQIANQRSPYSEGWHAETYADALAREEEKRRQDNADSVIQMPFKPKPTKMQKLLSDPVSGWNDMMNFSGPKIVDEFDDAVKKAGGSMMQGTMLFNQIKPNLPEHSLHIINPKADLLSKHLNTNSITDKDGQKDYKSSYDRSAAKPTQVIINIDKLANFDRTAIAGNSDERAIAEAIETKIAEAVMMMASQTLNSAGGLIAQGV